MKRIMHFAGWRLFAYGDKIIKVFAGDGITKFQLFISKPVFVSRDKEERDDQVNKAVGSPPVFAFDLSVVLVEIWNNARNLYCLCVLRMIVVQCKTSFLRPNL